MKTILVLQRTYYIVSGDPVPTRFTATRRGARVAGYTRQFGKLHSGRSFVPACPVTLSPAAENDPGNEQNCRSLVARRALPCGSRLNESKRGSCPRRGAFTVVVLVCLLVSAMVLASLLKLALLHDRQLGHVQMRLQAGWLADSGLERAAARLAVDPAYSGETWTIDVGSLGGQDAAVVVIHVENDESQTQRRRIVVEAVYPAEGPQHARVTRQTTITLAQEK